MNTWAGSCTWPVTNFSRTACKADCLAYELRCPEHGFISTRQQHGSGEKRPFPQKRNLMFAGTCSALGDSPPEVLEVGMGRRSHALQSAQTSAAKRGSCWQVRQPELQCRWRKAKELPANVTLRERKGKETNCFVLVVLSSNSSNNDIIIKKKTSSTTAPKMLRVAKAFLGTIFKQKEMRKD